MDTYNYLINWKEILFKVYSPQGQLRISSWYIANSKHLLEPGKQAINVVVLQNPVMRLLMFTIGWIWFSSKRRMQHVLDEVGRPTTTTIVTSDSSGPRYIVSMNCSLFLDGNRKYQGASKSTMEGTK